MGPTTKFGELLVPKMWGVGHFGKLKIEIGGSGWRGWIDLGEAVWTAWIQKPGRSHAVPKSSISVKKHRQFPEFTTTTGFSTTASLNH